METDPENYFFNWLRAFFGLFNHWRKEHNKNILSTSQSKQRKCDYIRIFTLWVTSLFRRGPESFREHYLLPFVFRTNLKILTVKQTSMPLHLPFPRFLNANKNFRSFKKANSVCIQKACVILRRGSTWRLFRRRSTSQISSNPKSLHLGHSLMLCGFV